MTELQTGLVKSALVVGVLLALYSFGYALYLPHQSELADKINDGQMEDLRRKVGRNNQALAELEELREEQRLRMKENEPLQLATLWPYGACALLLAAAAFFTRRDPRHAPWLARVAAAALLARLAVGVVDLRVAQQMAPHVGKSMQLGVRLAQRPGKNQVPAALGQTMSAFSAMAESATLATTLGWTVTLCGYFGWLAVAFWPRRRAKETSP